jgi:DNA-directed RNA polymerase specialized sigma24 family protein
MSLKPQLVRAVPTREDLFIERYEWLSGWALHFTNGDHEKAQDLVHDAYIQFTIVRGERQPIQNVDGYLYGMLRYLHLSQLRRAERSPLRHFLAVDYDSAEISLRAADHRRRVQLQHELWQICEYACHRKELSKAGSVLILRFFHGYFPSEIALLLRTTRQAVEKRLKLARQEAKCHLENRGLMVLTKEHAPMSLPSVTYASSVDELLLALRQMIFASRRGACLSTSQWHALHGATNAERIDCALAAHLVSCPHCIESVNRYFGLAPLSERYPTEMLGPDTRPKGGNGGGPPSGASGDGGGNSHDVGKSRRRAKEVFEHRPQELCVAVNGYARASQKVSGKLNELNVTVPGEELEFFEVLSEQGIRLLLVAVEGLPPAGSYQESRLVELSDGRILEATLSFSSPWPNIRVVYRIPLAEQDLVAEADVGETPAAPVHFNDGHAPQPEAPRFIPGDSDSWRWAGLFRRWGSMAAAGLLATVLIVAVALLTRHRPSKVPPISVAELLRNSTAADKALAAGPNHVSHRTIAIEERTWLGAVRSRQKIEVWRNGTTGVTARRLYNEKNVLTAGEWTSPNGSRTIYGRGAQPRTETSRRALALQFDDVWRSEPSASEFSAWTGASENIREEETPAAYVLKYENRVGLSTARLVQASLRLQRANLHATAESLVLSEPGDVREFHFTETGLEDKPESEVPPSVFEPEPELMEPRKPIAELPAPAESQLLLSPALELQALELLHRVGADMGDQLEIFRTPGPLASLVIRGVVDTPERKQEILSALAPLAAQKFAAIEIDTSAEALARRSQSGEEPLATIGKEPESTGDAIPLDSDLRRYFAAKALAPDSVDAQIRSFARDTLNRSLQLTEYAWALKGLARRFPQEDLATLDTSAKTRWLSLIQEYAAGLNREQAALSASLSPLFYASDAAQSTPAVPSIDNSAELVETADRLLDLCLANDLVIQAGFTISLENSAAGRIKGVEFWRSLRGIRDLSSGIITVTERLQSAAGSRK